MGRFVAVAAAIALALGACFFTPPRPGGGEASDAAADGVADQVDGRGSGSGSAGCPSDDMTDMATLCGTWGTADMATGGTLDRAGGELIATVAASGSHADCVTPLNVDFSHGVSVQLVAPAQGGSGDTSRFMATFDAGGAMTIQAAVTGGGLQVFAQCSGPGGFTGPVTFSSAHQWLKIAVLSGTTVEAQYSGDGETWNSFGSCSLSGNSMAQVSVRFGATADLTGAARSARFDNFRTCTTP